MNSIIRLRKLNNVENWQQKVTPTIEKLADLLLKTNGQASRPPILRKKGEEIYEITNENDPILIAAKLAETKGLTKLSVLIEENLTADWLEMENLLNATPKQEKVTKTATIATPKQEKVTKTATIATPNYRELQKTLKVLKTQVNTTIKLNSKKEILVAEWKKLQGIPKL